MASEAAPAEIECTKGATQQDRRSFPRHAVDCPVEVSFVAGAGRIAGKMLDLSLGGCRIETERRFQAGLLSRVEVQFPLRGIVFRIVGVTVGTRAATSFAVRFLDMPSRRQEELAEVLGEVVAVNAAKAAAASVETALESAGGGTQACASSVDGESRAAPVSKEASTGASQAARKSDAILALKPLDRRTHNRHLVDTSATLLLVKTGISMAGRILNLSQGGCRLRTEERFSLGIYVRVETEFYLHGLPFRLAGVSQAIMDKNTIGVRFLDMSHRKLEQLTELMAEIAEFEAGVAAEQGEANSVQILERGAV